MRGGGGRVAMRPLRLPATPTDLAFLALGTAPWLRPGRRPRPAAHRVRRGWNTQSPLVQSRGTLRDTLRIRRPCACWRAATPACAPSFRGVATASRSALSTWWRAGGGAAVALLLIPGAILCAVICAKSPGAGPLYSQWRIGRVRADGTYRPFRMWKFRSMVPNADEMLADLQGSNEADGPLFKIREDPRVVPGVGAFIRKHSIDRAPPAPERACRPDVPHRPQARPPKRGRPIRRARQAPPSGQTRLRGSLAGVG